MLDALYFDDLQLGDTFRSGARRVTADDVRAFAMLTGDANPLHLDEEFAARSPFG